jgi:hypothetical protein
MVLPLMPRWLRPKKLPKSAIGDSQSAQHRSQAKTSQKHFK